MTNETKSPAQAAPVVAASELSDEQILKLSEEWGVNCVTDERRPDNPTIIGFARAVLAAATPAERPTDDHLWDETLRDRDAYHEWADKLAEAIATHFGAYIGEHSNTNCPWAEALEVIEGAAPAVQQPAEGGWISVAERLPAAGELVMVYSPPTKYDHPGDLRISMDCIDPDDDDHASWLGHNEHYEHFCCVAKPEGTTGPTEKAPYTHWMLIPAAPTQAEGHSHE